MKEKSKTKTQRTPLHATLAILHRVTRNNPTRLISNRQNKYPIHPKAPKPGRNQSPYTKRISFEIPNKSTTQNPRRKGIKTGENRTCLSLIQGERQSSKRRLDIGVERPQNSHPNVQMQMRPDDRTKPRQAENLKIQEIPNK
jgi:hypothetical protein